MVKLQIYLQTGKYPGDKNATGQKSEMKRGLMRMPTRTRLVKWL